MIVRKVKSTELKRIKELFAVAFEIGVDNSQSPEELLASITANPESRLDLFWQSQWAAFEDDDQTMMSCFAAIPFPVHFDGHHCTMMGIGGVATLPPYRRRGGVRACFESALPDMYQEGAVFSYLYPFSTAYYRKFGYELCCERKKYKLLIQMLPRTPVSGAFHLVEQGNLMLTDIGAVYRAWQETYNMMVVNADIEYAWVRKANPFKDQEFTYVYKAADGTPKSYVSFTKEDTPDGRNLLCRRFFFVDPEGFYGLMNLFVSLAADHRYVTFEVPEDQEIEPLLPEWSMGAGSCERVQQGMARVVNVEKALLLARVQGSGRLVLDIQDAQIAENNGRFAIAYDQGRGTQVTKTQDAADAALTIQEFSRLLLGKYDVNALRFLKDVTVYTSPEKLAPLFYRKPLCITQYF